MLGVWSHLRKVNRAKVAQRFYSTIGDVVGSRKLELSKADANFAESPMINKCRDQVERNISNGRRRLEDLSGEGGELVAKLDFDKIASERQLHRENTIFRKMPHVNVDLILQLRETLRQLNSQLQRAQRSRRLLAQEKRSSSMAPFKSELLIKKSNKTNAIIDETHSLNSTNNSNLYSDHKISIPIDLKHGQINSNVEQNELHNGEISSFNFNDELNFSSLDRKEGGKDEMKLKCNQIRSGNNSLMDTDGMGERFWDEKRVEAFRLKSYIDQLKAKIDQISVQLNALALALPNTTHPSIKMSSENVNRVVRHFGKDYAEYCLRDKVDGKRMKKDHVQIGRELGIIDFESGVLSTGSGFVVLRGQGALLEIALVNYALSVCIAAGWSFVIPPDLVKSKFVSGAGFFPRPHQQTVSSKYSMKKPTNNFDCPLQSMAEQSIPSAKAMVMASSDQIEVYQETDDVCKELIDYKDSPVWKLENGNGLCLAGTAEIPLVASMQGRVLSGEPDRTVAVTHCFRPERGHSSRMRRGLHRLHQFTKVELFVAKNPDFKSSDEMLEEIVNLQEQILAPLGLPVRLVSMEAGEELGASAYCKYDCEVYLPSQNEWIEVSSASNCTDFQSRRIGIRYYNERGNQVENGENVHPQGCTERIESNTNDPSNDSNFASNREKRMEYAHTLNGTALAIPRIMQVLLEYGLQDDGSVLIPSILTPFMLDRSTHIKKRAS